jgi:hypothetical protein
MPTAYLCPKCRDVMRPHDGPWAVVHCIKCQHSCDLWYDTPETVEVEAAPEPYKPTLLVVQVRHETRLLDRAKIALKRFWVALSDAP